MWYLWHKEQIFNVSLSEVLIFHFQLCRWYQHWTFKLLWPNVVISLIKKHFRHKLSVLNPLMSSFMSFLQMFTLLSLSHLDLLNKCISFMYNRTKNRFNSHQSSNWLSFFTRRSQSLSRKKNNKTLSFLKILKKKRLQTKYESHFSPQI